MKTIKLVSSLLLASTVMACSNTSKMVNAEYQCKLSSPAKIYVDGICLLTTMDDNRIEVGYPNGKYLYYYIAEENKPTCYNKGYQTVIISSNGNQQASCYHEDEAGSITIITTGFMALQLNPMQ